MNKTIGVKSVVLGFTVLCGACQTPAIVRTARTLPEGEGDFTMAVNMTRLTIEETTTDTGAGEVTSPATDFTYPNLVPDLLYNYGITNDFEIGGRASLGSGLMELNGKYRFAQIAEDKLHLAAAPAVGYRALGLVSGPVLTLPVLATYDLTDLISVSGGPLISYASYSAPGSLEDDDANLSGDTLYAGGGAGIQFRTRGGFHFMPGVEIQRSVSRGGALDDAPAINFLFIGVALGWGPDQRLDKMDKQLDRIEEKLDKR